MDSGGTGASLSCLSADKDQALITLLHPSGPSHSHKYPQKEHVITLNLKYILTTVDPRSRLGRMYTLLKKDIKLATEKFARM